MAWIGLILFSMVAIGAICQTALMVLQTWENRRFGRRRMKQINWFYPRGRAMVVVPCKGLDLDLERNLLCLLDQDYIDPYDVFFVVQSDDDPACEVIRRVMRSGGRVRTRLIIAGEAADSGQKVHNLLAATEWIPADVEYLAFADSDVQPRREWLRSLVSHLGEPNVGAATGYRWVLPEKNTLANFALYSINCAVTLWLGRGGWHMVWGGSWAIGRNLFDSLNVRDAWRGALSDDLAVTSLLLRHKKKILFQPPCVVLSPIDYPAGEMLSFLRRQYFMARHYVAGYWRLAAAAALAPAAAWLSSVGWLAWGLSHGSFEWIPAVAATILFVLSLGRAWVRQDLVKTYFPELEKRLRPAIRFDLLAAPVVAWINCVGVLASAIGRSILWRGIRYRLNAEGRVVSLEHERRAILAMPQQGPQRKAA